MQKYIALDLETTGLDPKNDTIIEIAVVCFHREDGKNIFDDERTMLLDPERPLSQEFSLITGIQESMLHGRKKWREVEENIQKFFDTWSDAVIIGHNVQFDISMLEAHGIHFGGETKQYTILDTFELAEFLAQDAESLNLSFLCEKYEIENSGEHRALVDVKMSIALLEHCIQRGKTSDETDFSLLHNIAKKTKPGSITAFLDILKQEKTEVGAVENFSEIFSSFVFTQKTENRMTSKNGENQKKERHILSTTKEAEFLFLEPYLEEKHPIFLVIAGREQLRWIYEQWENRGQTPMIFTPKTSFISPEKIMNFIEASETLLDPKMGIFLMKICVWMRKTLTGNTTELRYYGDEFAWLEPFRTEEFERNFFTEKQEEKIQTSACVLIEMSDLFRINMKSLDTKRIFVREPFLLESIARREESTHIHFQALYNFFEKSGNNEECFAIDYIRNILESIPDRPDYTDPIPGDYGETYHFSQEIFWCRGGLMLHRAIDLLGDFVEKNTVPEPIRQMILALGKVSKKDDHNLSLVMKIDNESMRLSVIPRDIRPILGEKFAEFQDIITYDFGLTNTRMEAFFRENVFENVVETRESTKENPLMKAFFTSRSSQSLAERITRISRDDDARGIVVLVTSKKQAIEMRTLLANALTEEHVIITQGISGGKEKMIANYRKNQKNTILIGLYDSWIHTERVWKATRAVFLMKIPFDPPTDIFTLARTIGMSNNFMEYNLPTTILKIHTLLSHIALVNEEISISCLDARLWKNDWGKYIREEIFAE